ncbi:hypothetical protein B0H15DRAFT_806835 [Mycena belliarum]|uniref:Uncharacterized protein n=1 Tax=Mycena belliarum TaxID=1033014 RepID=A0AAD6TQ48_9AGAR|nr:hypothetical protein B0H15DRAFT_806835 [Mycena belliae]
MAGVKSTRGREWMKVDGEVMVVLVARSHEQMTVLVELVHEQQAFAEVDGRGGAAEVAQSVGGGAASWRTAAGSSSEARIDRVALIVLALLPGTVCSSIRSILGSVGGGGGMDIKEQRRQDKDDGDDSDGDDENGGVENSVGTLFSSLLHYGFSRYLGSTGVTEVVQMRSGCFGREITIMQTLRHPNICLLREVFWNANGSIGKPKQLITSNLLVLIAIEVGPLLLTSAAGRKVDPALCSTYGSDSCLGSTDRRPQFWKLLITVLTLIRLTPVSIQTDRREAVTMFNTARDLCACILSGRLHNLRSLAMLNALGGAIRPSIGIKISIQYYKGRTTLPQPTPRDTETMAGRVRFDF